MEPQSIQDEASGSASQTAQDYITSQLELEADAREALPYQFDTCTKPLGPLRQTVFSCLTCNPRPETPSQSYKPAGVCYSCSISCHTDHELVELFSRRDFECDCGTTRLPATSPCSLRINTETGIKGGVHSEMARAENRYNQNYKNRFCGCSELYDPHKQEGTMFQCLGLGTVEERGCGEDWWHPECVLGISKEWRISKAPKQEVNQAEHVTNGNGSHLITNGSTTQDNPTEQHGAPGDADDDDELPPGFPAEDDFEHLLCYKCVNAFPWIKQYAGAPGFLAAVERQIAVQTDDVAPVERDAKATGFAAPPPQIQKLPVAETPMARKRSFDEAALDATEHPEGQLQKKAKQEGFIEADTKSSTLCSKTSSHPQSKAEISLFLKEDFRDHLCRCPKCFPELCKHPQLLEEEDTYQPPPSDSEAGGDDSARSLGSKSLLDRGEAALSNMDRVRAIEGVMAYNHMRDKVKGFLKPFAESGQAVGADDIKQYFEKLRGDEQATKEASAQTNGENGGDTSDNRREQGGY